MISHVSELPRTGGILLATAIIRVFNDRGIEIFVRALIDPCLQASFISASLCQRLKLKTRKVNVSINGTGNMSLAVTKSAQVLIKPRFDSPFSCLVDTFVLQSVSSYTPPSMHTTLVLPHFSGLVLADPQYIDKSHIDLLLGAAVYTRIVEGAFIKGNLNEPLATPSALGWLLS